MRKKNSRSEQCRRNDTQMSPKTLQTQLSSQFPSFQEWLTVLTANKHSAALTTSPAPYPCDIEADDGSRISWHSHHTHPMYTENVHKYSAMSENARKMRGNAQKMSENAQKIPEIRKRMRKNVQNHQNN